MPEHELDEMTMNEPGDTPLHGYRGDEQVKPVTGIPVGLTIALSREAGARGTSIAQRAGEKLGWEVYTQELLEFISQDPSVRNDLVSKLPDAAPGWIDEQLGQLVRGQALTQDPAILDLARLVLALAAHGSAILLGRGAGFLLPQRTTLHVRLVAPQADRIAYMSQRLRLTEEEAAEQVTSRDHGRAEFLATHFGRKPGDVHAYDMVLNSSLLGEDRCAELIAVAARAKLAGLVGV